ncbi:MAG TPA: 2-oxoacid:acceptor oxidoreductase subunit alpha [Terriglobia bacterium]
MATTHLAPAETEVSTGRDQVVNDLSIQVATVNGSGSQSSNMVLLRALFQMGIPVSGKNLFPSNIEGLPTWFTIRTSKHGWVSRRKEIDFLVAVNAETADEDVRGLEPGSACVYDERLNLKRLRDDVVFYPVPFDRLVVPVCPEAKLRKLVRNMLYVGVVAHLLEIDMGEVEKALRKQFKKKVKAADLNLKAVLAGYDFAEKNLEKKDRFRVERMNANQGKILIEGNSAAALGCMMAGVTVVTWYPITPSSSLCETLIGYMKRYRMDPETGKATFAIVQAEDELAAIGMVIGAGWAGARAMTSTSGPGISLMAEFAGLGYYAEVPGVIFDIQRVGPSTGLPTRTAQGDVFSTAILSHGDTKHPLLFPSSVEECYTMAMDAFDLAEELQTPVFVMSDLDLGMNYWTAEPFSYPDRPLRRGKVLTAEDLERLGSFERYRDVDGDGVGYRTLPSNPHPAAGYFTRGSGHDEQAIYTERSDVYVSNMDRLARKFETARRLMPAPVIEESGHEMGLMAYGTTHWAITESRDQLDREYGVKTDYCRIRAFPFHDDVAAFVRRHRRVYVVEQNRDGQLAGLLRLSLEGGEIGRLRGVLHYDGLPVDARSVTDSIMTQEVGN